MTGIVAVGMGTTSWESLSSAIYARFGTWWGGTQ